MIRQLDNLKTRFGIVGHSVRLNQAIEIAVQVAPTEVSVLVNGENGTGKDIFSKIIHQYSKRKHQPFIAINCGAIPEGTMDSELFGHEKGSFTSAYESRKGYFEEVDGGTIFLDEIAEMPLATQSRLLRLLESGEYLRVGSSKVRKGDVRVIAATNKNLIEMIRIGRFREDLYFRLNTVTINVPPLRERGEDIDLLFRFFSSEFGEKYSRPPIQLDSAATEILYQYRWPGNVRELKNFSEKLTVLIEGSQVNTETLSQHLNLSETYLPTLIPGFESRSNGGSESREIELLYKLVFELRQELSEMKTALFSGIRPPATSTEHPELIVPGTFGNTRPTTNFQYQGNVNQAWKQSNLTPETPRLEESLSIEKKEKELISRALQKYHDNRKHASRELGISERTLYRKIKQYELE